MKRGLIERLANWDAFLAVLTAATLTYAAIEVPNFATAHPSAVAIKERGDCQTVSGEKSGRGRPLDLSIGEGRALWA